MSDNGDCLDLICRVPIREILRTTEEIYSDCVVILLMIFYFSVAYHILYDDNI